MTIVINGSGEISGISVGGLPDGIVDAGTLATNSVDSAELIDGSIDNSHIDAMAASKLTGALPAISGASLTGLKGGSSYFRACYNAAAWENLSDANKLEFDYVWVNEGSDFDTTNNRYVAPEDGVYCFYLAIYTSEDDTSNAFQWRKNGSTSGLQDVSEILCAKSTTGDAGDVIVNASLVVELDATDYVEIYSYGSSDVYTGHSSWGGFRLS